MQLYDFRGVGGGLIKVRSDYILGKVQCSADNDSPIFVTRGVKYCNGG